MKEKVTIIGGGWLGIPLAASLHQIGFNVVVSSRKAEKWELFKNNSWSPLGVTFSENDVAFNLLENNSLQTNVLILALPPTGFINYPAIIASLIAQIPADSQLILLSSTGVYEDTIGRVNESSRLKKSSPLVLAERLVARQKNHCILRLGGLIGPKRHPIHQIIKKGLPLSNGIAPVNLVHLNDVISAIKLLLSEKITGKTLAVCSPEHPSRSDYYNAAAHFFYAKEVIFNDGVLNKTVDGTAIEKWDNFCYSTSIYNFQLCN